jgi:RHS repeat-associated protein
LTTQLFFDGNGTFAKKVMTDWMRTIFIGGMNERDKTYSGAVTSTFTGCPTSGAMRIHQGPDDSIYYILGDQLDSTSVVVTATGTAVKGTQGYYPYGETRYSTDTIFTDRLYTGQQQLAGLGLYNYKARFYDPALGRFISADTLTPGGPEGLNRYSYVNNSPVNFVDPTGHECTKWDGQKHQCSEHDDNIATTFIGPYPNIVTIGPNPNPSPTSTPTPPPICKVKTPPHVWKPVPDDITAKMVDAVIGLGETIVDANEFGSVVQGINAVVPSPAFAFFSGLYVQGYKDSFADINPGEKIIRSVIVGAEYVAIDFLATGIGGSIGLGAAGLGAETGPFDIFVGGFAYIAAAGATTSLANDLTDKLNQNLFMNLHSRFVP